MTDIRTGGPRPGGIPVPSLRRLPIYYRRLVQALEQGRTSVSSKELGDAAEVPDAQVRKDLGYLSYEGRPGVGYDARLLAACLEEFLGLANDKDAVLVGLGNLGRALAYYPGFERYGLHIIAIFDNDPAKQGRLPDGRQVFPAEKLTELVSRLQIRIGIVTAPEAAAQAVADALIAGGVQVIWNFASCKLNVSPDVLVKNEDLAAELATLSHHITQRKLALA
ncbi:MAG: redox-sensing transcriptional repressor Rex [Nitrososphaerales archaeon]